MDTWAYLTYSTVKYTFTSFCYFGPLSQNQAHACVAGWQLLNLNTLKVRHEKSKNHQWLLQASVTFLARLSCATIGGISVSWNFHAHPSSMLLLRLDKATTFYMQGLSFQCDTKLDKMGHHARSLCWMPCADYWWWDGARHGLAWWDDWRYFHIGLSKGSTLHTQRHQSEQKQ